MKRILQILTRRCGRKNKLLILYKSAFKTQIGTLGLLANKESLLKLSFKGLKDITEEAEEDKGRFESIFTEL